MKNWEFTYRTKSGKTKVVNNENCWKHLEEDIWRGLTWCGDHLGTCLIAGGSIMLAVAASKQKKKEEQNKKVEVVYTEVPKEVAEKTQDTTEQTN